MTVSVKPYPAERRDFIESAFLGRMRPEDQAYMARALLQLCDEAKEMRDRIAALERAVEKLSPRP